MRPRVSAGFYRPWFSMLTLIVEMQRVIHVAGVSAALDCTV